MSSPEDEAGAAGGPTPDDADTTSTPETAKPQDASADPNPISGKDGHDYDEILPLATDRPAATEDRTGLLDEPGVDPLWRHHGEALAYLRARTGVPFTTDDLRDDGLGEPAHVNHWGLLMGAMARAGIVRAIGAGRSPRASRAGGLRTVWVGTDAIQRGAA